MRMATRLHLGLMLLSLLFASTALAQTGVVSGRVTDATDGRPMTGANVVLMTPGTSAMTTGAATGPDGRYRIADVPPGAYTLAVRFIGFQEAQVPVTVAAGQTVTVDVALRAGGFDLNTVVVTASRQAEKVLDAPASISVLSAEEVVETATPSTVDVLRNTTGVDMARTGVDRSEVVLRGFNNAFSGATYVLTDYRHAAVPSLGVNLFSVMPTQAIDVEAIEVVRGPGSALYGAGVDAGVIHFISKDPFTYPGTTVSVTGGERALFNGQLRHAGVVGEKLGYKITGSYSRADDWELDPNDPQDKQQLDEDAIPRKYDYESYNVNGFVQYRFRDGVSLALNAGHSSFTGTVLSGIGTLYGDGFGYTYGQLRLQAGNLFAQAYVNRNDAGNSTVYGTGERVIDNGVLYNAQAQYDLNAFDGRQQFIFGVDAVFTRPDTEGSILGRNEEEDDINEVGAYVQSTTELNPQFDLTLALRGDYNNIQEKLLLSPRAALVYKPTASHSVRATYNRAFSSPGTNSLFLDIVARAPDATLPIAVRARGSAYGYTFERNAAYAGLAGTDLVAYSLIPGMQGAPQPVGLPLDLIYGRVYEGIAAIPIDALTARLNQAGIPVNAQTTAALVALLSPQAGTNVQGFTRGNLAVLNLTTGAPTPIDDVSNVAPLKQTTTQTIELGYKGLFANKVLFAVDAYYTQKKDFIGPLLLETPFVFVPRLSNDLTAAVAAGISGNAQLNGALQQMGLTPEQVAGLIVAMAADQLPSATTPVAIVSPVENYAGPGVTPELMLTYRSYGNIQFWGADISTQVMATDALTLFGNLSFVSDDFFDNEELDEVNTSLSLALNAPTLKVRGGFDYKLRSGFSFNASGRYTEGFLVRSGPYIGDVDSFFLLDVGAGYDLGRYAPGLQLNVLIQNVLDDKHREFVGAPQIGRMALARLTYTF